MVFISKMSCCISDQVLDDVELHQTLEVGARQRPRSLHAARRRLCAFFAGGLAVGGVGGAFGLIFSFGGLTAEGFGDDGMT